MNKTWKKINQRACYNRIWSWSPVPCEKHGSWASVTTKTSAFGLGFCLLNPSGHVFPEMCSERDSPLEPFVLPAPGPTWTRAAHLWRPPEPTCADPEAEASTGQFTCMRSGGRVLRGGATRSIVSDVSPGHAGRRALAKARSQRLKQAAWSLPGESVSRGFAGRGASEGYPSHYTSLVFHTARQTMIKSDNACSGSLTQFAACRQTAARQCKDVCWNKLDPINGAARQPSALCKSGLNVSFSHYIFHELNSVKC